MILSRARFKIRFLMVVVAVVAMVLCAFRLPGRYRYCSVKAWSYGSSERGFLNSAFIQREVVELNRRRAERFRTELARLEGDAELHKTLRQSYAEGLATAEDAASDYEKRAASSQRQAARAAAKRRSWELATLLPWLAFPKDD